MKRLTNDTALTPRETQVLDHLSEGCPAKEIGARLQISPLTVHKHLQNAYRKLHAKNQVHAVVLHRHWTHDDPQNDLGFPVP